MNILVLNCGSSSIKYQLFNMTSEPIVLAKGQVDRIGISGSNIEQKAEGKEKIVLETEIPDHNVGMDLIIQLLLDKRQSVIKSLDEIDAVGHRIGAWWRNL